jgi:exosome complex RNA-binding protein Csl4
VLLPSSSLWSVLNSQGKNPREVVKPGDIVRVKVLEFLQAEQGIFIQEQGICMAKF